MRLSLRRGVVASIDRGGGATVELTVEVNGERRPAIADRGLTGETEPGDEVVVNTLALDLGLASGGFDVVHVNLTRGLGGGAEAAGARGEEGRAIKLNYTSLQHAVDGVEASGSPGGWGPPHFGGRPVAVLALHGQLEPVAWAAGQRRPGARVGFVQTLGGALPGGLSRAVGELRARGLLAGHVTAGQAFGGEHEAVTVAGALAAGCDALGWDAAIVGPGPGIVGTGSPLGHGGLAALDSAHASLSLGARTVLVPRMSSGDPRARHRGVSHHSATVLGLLLRPVAVAVPAALPDGLERGEALAHHELLPGVPDLEGYRASGLSSRTMGRSLDEDELFFSAALAGGAVLGEELSRV